MNLICFDNIYKHIYVYKESSLLFKSLFLIIYKQTIGLIFSRIGLSFLNLPASLNLPHKV